MKVSIVVAAYNHEQFVREALESALVQDVGEIIVIDDGSRDDTRSVCRRMAETQPGRVQYLEQVNQGVSVTLNRLVQLARGEYVAFLASDDAFEPNKIARQLRYLEQHPDADWLFSRVSRVDAKGVPTCADDVLSESVAVSELPRRMCLENVLCASSGLVRRSDVLALGGFATDLVFTQDYDLWLRALKQGVRIHVVPEVLTRYRWHGNNLSGKSRTGSVDETWQILLRHGHAILERYPEAFDPASTLGLAHFYEHLIVLTKQSENGPGMAAVLRQKIERVHASERDAIRLMECLLNLQRVDALKDVLRLLSPIAHHYTPRTRDAIARMVQRFAAA